MSDPQPAVNAPQTRDAIFLVLALGQGTAAVERARMVCGQLDGLVRAVAARDIQGNLSCAAAFGSDVWDRLFGQPRPAELHPFRELRSGKRFAPATAGDIL